MRFRVLLLNLKDEKNSELREKIILGQISAKELSTIDESVININLGTGKQWDAQVDSREGGAVSEAESDWEWSQNRHHQTKGNIITVIANGQGDTLIDQNQVEFDKPQP